MQGQEVAFGAAAAERVDPGIAPDRRLEAEIGSCGMAQIAGASVAVPYVSALAAAIAIARLIS